MYPTDLSQPVSTPDGLSKAINAKASGPPAKFPQNPVLTTKPSGGPLKKGYASGAINPGSSVTVKLKKAGIYLFGCAFHYHEGMQDVIVVKPGATPGPQATKPA